MKAIIYRFLIKIIKKIDPETYQEIKKFYYLRDHIHELKWWMGKDFPEVQESLDWLTKSMHVHFMPLSEWDNLTSEEKAELSTYQIHTFREDMRRKYKRHNYAE